MGQLDPKRKFYVSWRRSACADRGHPLTRQPLDRSKSDRSPAQACHWMTKPGSERASSPNVEFRNGYGGPYIKKTFLVLCG